MTLKNADAKEIIRNIKNLIKVCTFNDLEVDKLPYFDVEYIFMMIRSKSISEVVNVNVNCKCGNKIPSSYNIEDMRIENKENITKNITLDKNLSITLKYPTIEQTVNIFDNVENFDDIENLIVDCIETITNNDKVYDCKNYTKQELKNFIESLSKKQFDAIDDFFENSPQIVQNVKTKCDKCDTEIDIDIKGLYNFFL